MHKPFQKYLAELVGTYLMVFCGTGAMTINEVTGGSVTHVGIAMTFGLIVMAVIYAFGSISGAHINPAVTIGFWAAKRFPSKLVLPYIASQLAGAILASYTLYTLFPASKLLGMTLPADTAAQAAILEFILTFILMIVIIQVATGSKETGIMAGIAIGSVVLLEAMFAGPITGASMNPARSIGPALATLQFQHLWLYIAAPILGALAAVGLFKLLQPAGESE